MAVDWTNACARATALRDAYFSLLSGDKDVRVVIRNGEHERDVTFSAANLATLKSELREAEAECAAASGTGAGRRSAIRLGARR